MTKIPFVHLHVHTYYSLLDGASRISDLILCTKQLGMDSIAITDHGAMYGVIEFYKEAKKQGIRPIIGCEAYLAPASRFDRAEVYGTRYYHLILLAENNEGYKNLVKLVSLANTEGMYYKPRVDKEILQKHSKGLICLSACVAGEIPQAILQGKKERAERLVAEYIDIFGKDNFFLEIQDHGLRDEKTAFTGIMELAKKFGVGLVATNDVHYVRKEDTKAHDVLLAIQTGRGISDPTRLRYAEGEFYLRSPEEMKELFKDCPEAIYNTKKIAERCNVEFTFGQLHLPHFPLPDAMTDVSYLKQLCEENLAHRYEEITPFVRKRLDYELSVIKRMGYDSYFLIVWDLIKYAKSKGIAVGPGRGSATGSIVAYLLGITNLDPLKYELLFERFLNPERVTMPDIDIDFCYIRREEIIDYVKHRYGSEHVAQIITFGTMAAKGSIRDVGRALEMSYASVDRVAKAVPSEPGITLERALFESQDFLRIYEESEEMKRLIDLARELEGLPRHSSTHAAGVVIAKQPLTDYVPVQVSDGTLVTEYDKDHVEALGLLKMDFLGLRTLTVITDALKHIKLNRGISVDIDKIPLADEKTAAMLCRGDTGAVFQMESAGMTNLVKDLQPKSFQDLIPTIALYRPGPLKSGMVTDFIAGRHGKKQVTYLHPLLEPILKETFGVVLYQEQVMQVVQVLANFTLGQADILRRAMGKKKHDVLNSQREAYMLGTAKNGIDPALAEKIFDLLTNFADYGFNKSHSAAYALVAWQTAYLKAHYQQEYMAAMLTSIMDTNDKVGIYIDLCRHMGIKILPPDVNASKATFSVDGTAIRFGLAAVRNVGEAAIKSLVLVRKEGGKFTSLLDFCTRVDMRTVNKRVIESLIKCGAFDSLGVYRSQLLAVLERVVEVAARRLRDALSNQIGLFDEPMIKEVEEVALPSVDEVDTVQKLAWEKENTGFFITGHPLDRYENKIKNLVSIADILDGKKKERQLVRIGGLVAAAKRIATKKGDTMCFLTLEDYTHTIEVVVFPSVFYKNVNLLAADAPLVVQGRVNFTDEGVKVLADTITALDEYRQDYYITLDKKHEKETTLAALYDILAAYSGDHSVFLNRQGRWHKLDPKYWLNKNPAILNDIEKLLGKGSVQQR